MSLLPGTASGRAMPLAAGQRLGPYEIVAKVGEGGMGTVYRARDTRLDREVAIKVSQEQFSERFDREARAISSLNHPNICALYDVGPDYLVMEYVQGEPPRGPMPVDEALAIAMQIAEALREAHDKGIVHRDLKPANIKVTPDGNVKVLDFGLAKAIDQASGSRLQAPGELTQSPTITSPARTHVGVILGTAAYMAPEQARGKPVDTRADIWAFGVVLYELLTGQRVFKGDDLTETLASVVKDQPDLASVPPRVRPLLEACLQKDPKKRLQSIGDVGLLLRGEPVAVAAASRRGLGMTTAVALAAVALVAIAGLAVLSFVHFREAPPVERALRLSIPIPDGTSVGFVELSPDGQRVLLQMTRGETAPQLFVRSLDAHDLRLLVGTDNGRNPFWSPDGRYIGFFANNSLKVIPAGGGPVRVLCGETGLGGGGAWNRDGAILFAGESGRLRRVDAEGGDCRTVGNADSTFSPLFLPDGDHFFYVNLDRDSARQGVYLANLAEPAGRRVLEDVSAVLYTPASRRGGHAHLLFLRDGTLMAQPFDDANLQRVGDPFAVAAAASFALSEPHLAAGVSPDGTLVYLTGRSRDSQLTWFDRTGAVLGTVGPKGDQTGMSLSPDGNRVAITRRATNDPFAVWVHDLVSGSAMRLTPIGSPGFGGLWSPDSSKLWFGMTTPQGDGRYQQDFTTSQQELLEGINGGEISPTDRSRDGRWLVYTMRDPRTRSDIWYAPIESGRTIDRTRAVRLIGTNAIESQGQLSPDGKWLAYLSTESGTYEVYVRPFPTGTSVWKVSPGRAEEPRWRADGKELFFKTSTPAIGQMTLWATSVASDGGAGLRVGTPRKLFDALAATMIVQSNSWAYSAHPDGQRFLIEALTEVNDPTVNVITHWQQTVADATAR